MRVLLTQTLVATVFLRVGELSAPAVPPVEQLLPAETVAMVSTPGLSHLKDVWNKMPQGALWQDDSFRPFREKFMLNLQNELFAPLRRDLGLDLETCRELFPGPLTLALVRTRDAEAPLGIVFLTDAAEKRSELSTNLTNLRHSWLGSGKSLRTVKIRDVEFLALSVRTNDLPSLTRFFPRILELQEIGAEKEEGRASPAKVLIGQVDSLLVVTSSEKAAEKIVIRAQNGTIPALGDSGAYQFSQRDLFRNASVYGWADAQALMGLMVRRSNTDVAAPMDVVLPSTFLRAIGFGDLDSVSFAQHISPQGVKTKVVLGVPESRRRGLFKVFLAQNKEAGIPPFVPADAVRFRRWRVDGQRAWGILEQVLAEMSPQWTRAINFILSTANDAAKLKDPDFELERNLIGNIGDDLIYVEKAARDTASGLVNSPPCLWLVSSPNPQQLAASLKSVLIFMTAQAETPAEREFLGRKILSVPLPYLPNPLGDNGALMTPRTLHYAATSGYVALSTEAALVEEYLRSPESNTERLLQMPGLAGAAEKVLKPGTVLFGFHNQQEAARLEYEGLRSGSAGKSNSPLSSSLLTGVFGLASPEKKIQELMDFSLLPPFERVARHIGFSVHSGSVTTEAITFDFFTPSQRPAETVQAARSN